MTNLTCKAILGAVFGLMAGGVAAQDIALTQADLDGARACAGADGLAEGQTVVCSCAPDSMSGSVWGTDIYTTDSSVCAAALHAGAVAQEGGVVVLTGVPGQSKYAGTARNGITTRDWGSYGSSFTVATAVAARAVEACDTLRADQDRLTCGCPAGSGLDGSVWGYSPYTADSDICTAARHTGIIDDAGGVVTVMRVPGLESYAGGMSNGVTSSFWGRYGSSIVFDWNAE